MSTIGRLLGHRLASTTAKYASRSSKAQSMATNTLGSLLKPQLYAAKEPKMAKRQTAAANVRRPVGREQKAAGLVHPLSPNKIR